MTRAGLSSFVRVVVGGMTPDQAHDALRRSFRVADRPSAVFAATHVMALGALRAIWKAGFALPRNIDRLLMTVAVDDRPATVPLDASPMNEIAQEAWSVLTEQIQGRPVERVNRVFPCTLIVRESTTGVSKASPCFLNNPRRK